MISVQTVIERIESALDAEGSDRYTFDEDYKTAINSSVEWLQAVFNKAFGDKKLTEEDLKELIKVVVFQTNQYSRIQLDFISDSIWSILRVNPKPNVLPSNATIIAQVFPETSVWREDLSYLSSEHSAKLLSLEQWEENVNNIFEAGNDRMSGSFVKYAYLNYADYSSTNYNSTYPEIEIRPAVPSEFVGVTYLKYPTPVTQVTDNIEFPKSLINLVVQKALNFISFKQGDQTNLYAVTDRDVRDLVKMMI